MHVFLLPQHTAFFPFAFVELIYQGLCVWWTGYQATLYEVSSTYFHLLQLSRRKFTFSVLHLPWILGEGGQYDHHYKLQQILRMMVKSPSSFHSIPWSTTVTNRQENYLQNNIIILLINQLQAHFGSNQYISLTILIELCKHERFISIAWPQPKECVVTSVCKCAAQREVVTNCFSK